MDREDRAFEAEILDVTEVHALPGGWPTSKVHALLTSLDVDDVGDEDAMEMCVMALQDLDVDEASDRVLETVFGDRMRPGVRQNLIPDLREDRPWEEFADITHQAGIFEAVVLLQQAFPREFGKPDAVSLLLRVASESQSARRWLDVSTPDAGLLLRIVAACMDERAVLRRLFEQPLAGPRFPEARGILWHVEPVTSTGASCEFLLISSHQWFDAVPDHGTFAARAWPDRPEKSED